jgi:glycosyltransferase involved in cell wall biosynthesis
MNTAILIPAYEPDTKLVKLVYELSGLLFPYILVVDDGSSKKCEDIFRIIENVPNCCVVHHSENMGKGASIKTGMNSIMGMDKKITGCVTVDADGQHLPKDIIKVAEAFEKDGKALVLGCRDFLGKSIPVRSRFWNLITRTVFELVIGKRINDTQTGLGQFL